MTNKREVFLSVDVETSGPIPGEYSLLAIGACDVSDPTRTFSCELRPTAQKFDPDALDVTGLSLDRLMRDGLEPAVGMQAFKNWVVSTTGPNASPVFVGFNAAFDWSFVNYYFHRYLGENPFGFAALDIKSMYMGATRCSWAQTRSSQVASALRATLKGDHDALHDAQFQAELFRLIQQRT
jgi:DNA polymerase III epsilon subunit-like protein